MLKNSNLARKSMEMSKTRAFYRQRGIKSRIGTPQQRFSGAADWNQTRYF